MILPAPFTENKELDIFNISVRDYINRVESQASNPVISVTVGGITNSLIDTDSVDTRVLAPDAVADENIQSGAVTITKLATSGTPTATTYLNGDMEWTEPSSGRVGAVLLQTQVTANRYLNESDLGGHIYHPEFHDVAVILSIPDHDDDPLLMPVGSSMRIINLKNDLVLRIDNGTLYLMGSLTTSPAINIADFGSIFAVKVDAYKWAVEGFNLSAVADPGDSIPPFDFYFPGDAYTGSFDFDF